MRLTQGQSGLGSNNNCSIVGNLKKVGTETKRQKQDVMRTKCSY